MNVFTRTICSLPALCALFFAGCRSGELPPLPPDWPPEAGALYGYAGCSDKNQALEKLAGRAGRYPQTLTLLNTLRSTADHAAAERCRRRLKQLGIELTGEILQEPTGVNTFILAELCNEPASGLFDRQLAAALYSYSAERGFPPAALQLGKLLRSGSGVRQNPVLAEELLQYAFDQKVLSAGYELYRLYSQQNDPRAESILKTSAAAAETECSILQIIADDPEQMYFFADRSANAAWLCAMQKDIFPQDRLEFLLQALQLGHPRAAAALAFFYQEKPHVQPFAAASAALLAVNSTGGSDEAYALLRELDAQHHLGMAAVVIWQNRLQTPAMFLKSCMDLEQVLVNLTNHVENRHLTARNKLENALQSDPDGFYLSGITFRLQFYGLTKPEIRSLLQKTPANADRIAAVTTQLLFAAECGDHQTQADLSLKLLELLAHQSNIEPQVDLRSKLAMKIPGAALLEPRQKQLADPENTLAATWNLAVDLHTAALLAQGRKQSAEEFLTRHPRFKLPAELSKMERNMVKRFAPQLLQK